MTNITREAVERSCAEYDLGLLTDQPMSDLCRALLARVESLEAAIDGPTYLAGKADGRLQGLDEAAIELRNKYEYQAARYVEALTEESQTNEK